MTHRQHHHHHHDATPTWGPLASQTADIQIASAEIGAAELALTNPATTPPTTPATIGTAAESPPNDASDIAVDGSQARAAYGVTGAGIKVGIISDSFNADGGYATDVADGYLPANVTVLGDMTSAELSAAGLPADEGRAMAELVYETAPGAQLYFDTAGTSEATFAAAVTALTNAGCNIIVDDVYLSDEPFFQEGDALDNAIESFVQAGGNYFTAAGNAGDDYYQATFNPIQVTLAGLGQVEAENFGNGETLQTVTIPTGADIELDLQWDQPFPTTSGSGGSQNNLSMYLYRNGRLIAQSATAGAGEPDQLLQYDNTSRSTTFELAIVWNSGTTAPGLFRYVNFDDQITIDDPNAGTGEGDLFGHEMLSNVNVVGAANVLQAPPDESPPVAERYSSYGPGELLFDNNGTRLATPTILKGVSYVAPDGSDTSVPGFAPFDGTSAAGPVAAAIAALMLQENPGLTPAQVTADLEASAIPMSTSGPQVGAGFIQATTALELASCFCPGTRILTDKGEVPVETLRPGDVVVAADARGVCRLETVLWTGRRTVDLTVHPDPELVAPIRIRAGAIAADVPKRDLMLSPDHCLLMRQHLLRTFRLMNGVSVVQERPREVTYLHVELDRHALLFAEGLRAESYLDEGFRAFFDGTLALPGTLHARPRTDACAPFVTDDALAERIWRDVARPAGATPRTPPASCPAALRLLAGEHLLRPIVAKDRHIFAVPPGSGRVRLISGTTRPTDSRPWSEDRRRLGVGVRRIAVDGTTVVPLDSPALGSGWHAPERGPARWTDGDARLDLSPGTRVLEVRLTA